MWLGISTNENCFIGKTPHIYPFRINKFSDLSSSEPHFENASAKHAFYESALKNHSIPSTLDSAFDNSRADDYSTITISRRQYIYTISIHIFINPYFFNRSLPKLSSQDEDGGGAHAQLNNIAHFEPIPHDHDFCERVVINVSIFFFFIFGSCMYVSLFRGWKFLTSLDCVVSRKKVRFVNLTNIFRFVWNFVFFFFLLKYPWIWVILILGNLVC